MSSTNGILMFRGYSGEKYRFLPINPDDRKAWPNSGGVLIFASYAPEPTWIGETHDVREFLAGPYWEHAKGCHQATMIYAHFVSEERKRRQAANDLIRRYDSVMNKEGL